MRLESKKLYKEALAITAHPKVVDLTQVKRRPPLQHGDDGDQKNELRLTTGKVWQLKERLPHIQFDRRKEEVEQLRKKIEAFKERTHAI